MDDLIQFWVVIAVIAISVINAVIKRKKGKEEDLHKTTLPGKKVIKVSTDSQPVQSQAVAVEWDEWFLDKEKKVYTLPVKEKPVFFKKKDVKEKSHRNLERTPIPSSNFKLKSKEEARRAFIYSEIFNRKY